MSITYVIYKLHKPIVCVCVCVSMYVCTYDMYVHVCNAYMYVYMNCTRSLTFWRLVLCEFRHVSSRVASLTPLFHTRCSSEE